MVQIDALIKDFQRKPVWSKLSKGFKCVYWIHPCSLSDDDKSAIYAALADVSTIAFGADMKPYWHGRSHDGYLDKITKFFLIIDPENQVVGWTGFHRFKVGETSCLFLDSTGVLPGLQKTGVMTQVLGRALASELIRNRLRPVYLSMRTENPVVYYAFFKIVGPDNIYPNLAKEAGNTVRQLGKYIAGWLKQDNKFEPETLRIRGAYDNLDALYGEQPLCEHEKINGFFQKHLRPEDAFIVLAKMDVFGSAKLFTRGLAYRLMPKHLRHRTLQNRYSDE
ncbi:MAG TPA: GNAT family N-acetyltransferase [Blastocatellia bacterium]|jgi:hypothetical protein|nr:GNAT family N-acetyltransferase [Blastocatellia bacterium]